jgi:lysophospholipase L1-like esterase
VKRWMTSKEAGKGANLASGERVGAAQARRPLRRWVVGIGFILVWAVVLIGLDRLLGIAVPSLDSALLFSAGTTARYETSEFDVTARNNTLGLRGGELVVERPQEMKRIVAIGDSFTWGWGVPDSGAWPAVLEVLLKDSGIDVEVVNAGQPGANPFLYARNAARVVPVLKPDLVIIGVLQGDDIQQLRNALAPEPVSMRVRHALRVLVPNMTGLAKRLRASFDPVVEIGVLWRRQAQMMLRAMPEVERRRYEKLEAEVRVLFENGRLNPFLVQIALRQPDYFVDATRKERLEMPQGIMAESLRELTAMAAAHGSEVMVVAIPYPVYISRPALEAQRRIGFELDEGLLTSEVPDRTIQEASDRAGVPCITLSAEFRDRCESETLFFPLDGHLNEAGHRYLAGQLAPLVEQRLRRDR